jgi:hypothetical protein
MPVSRRDVIHIHATYPVHSKERKSAFNASMNAFPNPIPHSFHSPTSPTLPINTHSSPTSSPTPKPSPRCQAATAVPCSLKTALLPQIDDHVPDDLPNQMRSNFTRWCTMLFYETYLKISLQRRPDATRTSSSLAVIPGLHTFCSHHSIFVIILPISEISSMQRPYHGVS